MSGNFIEFQIPRLSMIYTNPTLLDNIYLVLTEYIHRHTAAARRRPTYQSGHLTAQKTAAQNIREPKESTDSIF